jgi:hypothetical protein
MYCNYLNGSSSNSNKVSVEKSSINWYQWGGDPQRTLLGATNSAGSLVYGGKRTVRDFVSERENYPFAKLSQGHPEIFTTARFEQTREVEQSAQ